MNEGEWVTGTASISINGVPTELQVTVPAGPVKPQRMLPILQKMANAFVEASVAVVEAGGKAISCKAGCGACCRQPVPISEIEVYRIAELVDAMPEPRRTMVRDRFAAACEHFHSIGWFDRMNAHYGSGQPKETLEDLRAAQAVIVEYFSEGTSCPFLENGSCSIYDDRPLICREYLVTSPAENCSAPSAETVRMIELVAKPSKAALGLGGTGRLKDYGLLTLIRALEIAAAVPEDFDERPGPQWMDEFLARFQAETASQAAN